MPKRKTAKDAIRIKSPTQTNSAAGGLDYMPPSGGRYLMKNGDEIDDKADLEEFVRLVLQDII